MLKHLWKVAVVGAVGAIAAASASTIGNVSSPTLAEGRIHLTGCTSTGDGVHTSFTLNQNDNPVPHNQISSVTFTGLSSDCNGKYAHVAFIGNPQGVVGDSANFGEFGTTSAAFATSGSTTNCIDKTTSPWTLLDQQSGTGGQIAGGSVTVNFCSSNYPDVAPLTQINLVVSETKGF